MIEFIQANWVELIGAIFGIIYLYYEYSANIKMWPTGIIMSAFYIFVFIHSKIYAFACINVYYIFAGIYGWIKWKEAVNKESEEQNIIHMPKKHIIPILLATLIVLFFISYVLATYTDSPVIYGDSIVTTFSIIAMWMLAQKYVEQWLLVIVLNIISIFLYFSQDLYPTSVMYLIYSVVSVMGYFNWKRKAIKKKLQ